MSDRLAAGIKAGATSVSLPVELRKAADSTALTAVIHSGVTASYWRQGGVRVAITPVTLGSVNAAYSSGGFLEVDATNMPGVYRFDVPDAAFATGADWVVISLKVATAFQLSFMFALESVGAAELATFIGDVPTNAELAAALGTADDAMLVQLATIATYIDTEVAAIKAKTDNLPAAPAAVGDIPSLASIRAGVTTDHGTGSYVDTGGSVGSGAFTVTVIVTDGVLPLQNAIVRLTEGINTFLATTNASGVATLPSMNAALYDLAITKDGYQFTPDTIAVTGNANFDAVMTTVVLPSPGAEASLCRVFGYFEDLANIESGGGIPVNFQLSEKGPVKSERLITGRTITALIVGGQLTDAGGNLWQDLQGNDNLTPEATTYLVTCAALGLKKHEITLEGGEIFDMASIVS